MLRRTIVIVIYIPVIYSAPCVMLLMRAASITRASGRGLGPGNCDFFGPCEMASSRHAGECHLVGPKKVENESIDFLYLCHQKRNQARETIPL